jgi:hypothetical protein
MKTHLRTHLVLLSCFTCALLLAGCATTRSDALRASVSRLDDTTRQFSSQIPYQGDDRRRDRVSRDADTLANAAHNLNRALRSGSSRDDFDTQYLRVKDGYEHLHSQLADEGYAGQNQRLLAGFDRVTAAYKDVAAGMGTRAATTRDGEHY